MVRIGHINIVDDEIETISWEAGTLTVQLRWSMREVPLLLELPEVVLVSWADDDDAAGVPVRIESWEHRQGKLRLRVLLSE